MRNAFFFRPLRNLQYRTFGDSYLVDINDSGLVHSTVNNERKGDASVLVTGVRADAPTISEVASLTIQVGQLFDDLTPLIQSSRFVSGQPSIIFAGKLQSMVDLERKPLAERHLSRTIRHEVRHRLSRQSWTPL